MYSTKELVYKINHEVNFDKKLGMLEMLNMVHGFDYGLLNGRVISKDFYGNKHDVYVVL